ncbi:hypothetical protein pb186bvf_014967 [Paramecium bursaria]
MGNNQCSEHHRQQSDQFVITEENVILEDHDASVHSQVPQLFLKVEMMKDQKISAIPIDTILYLTEMICTLSKHTTKKLQKMIEESHPALQAVIKTIIKHKPIEDYKAPLIQQQINDLKLFYQVEQQNYQQIHYRPVYDENYNIIREVKVNKHNDHVIKEDNVFDVEVTIKRFEHWLQISKINHPHILNLKAAVIDNNKCKYLTQFICGSTLDKIECTNDQKLVFTKQMIEAVRFIHQNHLIHGDIKPSNFMVSKQNVVLMDLDQLGSQLISADMTYLYSMDEAKYPTYMGDVWSLGLTIYQMYSRMKIIKGWCYEDYKRRDYPQNFNYGLIEPILKACLTKIPKDIFTIHQLTKLI